MNQKIAWFGALLFLIGVLMGAASAIWWACLTHGALGGTAAAAGCLVVCGFFTCLIWGEER